MSASGRLPSSVPFAWLAALDDMLTERHRACLGCGQRADRLDLRIINGRAWAVALCRGCLARDPDCRQIDGRLAARAQEAGW